MKSEASVAATAMAGKDGNNELAAERIWGSEFTARESKLACAHLIVPALSPFVEYFERPQARAVAFARSLCSLGYTWALLALPSNLRMVSERPTGKTQGPARPPHSGSPAQDEARSDALPQTLGGTASERGEF